MTTGGEGGMVTTDDHDLWARIWSYKDHGKSWGAVYERKHEQGFRWLHDTFGTNARMLEFQAVIGRIQLRRMPEWHGSRAANAARLAKACRPFDVVRVPTVADNCVHAYYRFYAFVRPECLAPGWTRDRIVEEIVVGGVPCYHGSCSEIYREKAFDGTDLRPAERLPVASELGDTSVMLLVHPTLTEAEIDRTCDALANVLSGAGG